MQKGRARRRAHRRRKSLAWWSVLAGMAVSAAGQEAIRMSLTGEAAAEARRRAAATFGYYNLKLGPVAWRFEALGGAQYHDNISYAGRNPRSDFILRPQANTAMRWTITEKNSLNVSFGVGYLKYINHGEFDRFYIEPGSEIGFDLYVGNFLFNFHDRVTIRTDVGEIPIATSRGDYQRLENIIGVTTHWDLNSLILTLGYDHADYLSLNSTLRLADGSSEIVFARGSFALGANSAVGPELGVTSVDYTDTRISDALQYSAGLFYRSQLTSQLELKVRGGYTYYDPDPAGPVQTVESSGNLYADVTLRHEVGQQVSYSLSAGRHVRTGLEYGSRTRPLTVTYVNWSPTWRFLREIQLTTPVSYQRGEENGVAAEEYDYWSAGLSAARMLTSKLSGRISYRHLQKDSNRPAGDYSANIVSLIFTYRF